MYSSNIEPITHLKTDSARLVKKVRQGHEPVYITQNGEPVAVLMDVALYERQKKALYLLKHLMQRDQTAHSRQLLTEEEANQRLDKKLAGLEKST